MNHKSAKDVLAEHCLINDIGLESAIVAAMEEYANQKDEDLQKMLDDNCSEFDINPIG